MKLMFKVKVEGLRELEAALKNLPKATARNVLRKVLTKRAEPMAETMRALAPDDPVTRQNDLKQSIAVGTKLSKRQASLHRRETKDHKDFAEVFVGAGPKPQATLQEFGTVHHGPQAFGRPAWDGHQGQMLDGIKEDLWAEIDKAAARYAKRLAKAKG